MRALFQIVPSVYLFFIPAITMGIISREKNIGTMEVMCTLPIRDFEFVLGKYFAVLTLLKVALFLTGIMFINLIFVTKKK